MRRLSALIAAAVLGLSAGGCGGSSESRDARVAGTVQICGGTPTNLHGIEGGGVLAPGPPSDAQRLCRGQEGKLAYEARVRISIKGRNGRAVASSYYRDGKFSFDVAPGSYTVIARFNMNVTSARVKAVAGHTSQIRLTDVLE